MSNEHVYEIVEAKKYNSIRLKITGGMYYFLPIINPISDSKKIIKLLKDFIAENKIKYTIME